MYRTVSHTRRFDMDEQEQLDEYNSILNDPNCSIVRMDKEKLTDKDFSEEGKLLSMSERIVLIVTWEEKVLL